MSNCDWMNVSTNYLRAKHTEIYYVPNNTIVLEKHKKKKWTKCLHSKNLQFTQTKEASFSIHFIINYILVSMMPISLLHYIVFILSFRKSYYYCLHHRIPSLRIPAHPYSIRDIFSWKDFIFVFSTFHCLET